MNDIVYHFIDPFVIIYLDDTLVYNATLEECRDLNKVSYKMETVPSTCFF